VYLLINLFISASILRYASRSTLRSRSCLPLCLRLGSYSRRYSCFKLLTITSQIEENTVLMNYYLILKPIPYFKFSI